MAVFFACNGSWRAAPPLMALGMALLYQRRSRLPVGGPAVPQGFDPELQIAFRQLSFNRPRFQLFRQAQNRDNHLMQAPHLPQQTVHFCPLAGRQGLSGPAAQLLIEEPQILLLSSKDGDDPPDGVIIQDISLGRAACKSVYCSSADSTIASM